MTAMAFARRHAPRLVKFALSGVIGACIDFGGLFFLLESGVDKRYAVVLSSIPAVVVVFLMNKFFTFKAGKGNTGAQLVKFVLVYGAAFAWNAGLSLFFLGIGFPAFAAKFFAIGCVAVWNYCLLNGFVFRR